MQITVTMPDEMAQAVMARGLTPERYVEDLIAVQVASIALPIGTAARLSDLEQYSKEMAVHSKGRRSCRRRPLCVRGFTRIMIDGSSVWHEVEGLEA